MMTYWQLAAACRMQHVPCMVLMSVPCLLSPRTDVPVACKFKSRCVSPSGILEAMASVSS